MYIKKAIEFDGLTNRCTCLKKNRNDMICFILKSMLNVAAFLKFKMEYTCITFEYFSQENVSICCCFWLLFFTPSPMWANPIYCPHHWWLGVEDIHKPPYKQTCIHLLVIDKTSKTVHAKPHQSSNDRSWPLSRIVHPPPPTLGKHCVRRT